MTWIDRLAHFLHPWEAAYSRSKAIAAAVIAVHLTALLIGGGLAVAADRMTIRSLKRGAAERLAQLDELHAVHRPVLIAILFLFTSGALLATADIKTFIGSGFFIAKLSLVTLLMVNGSVLALSERGLRRAAASGSLDDAAPYWPRLRATAWISLLLWMATLIAGVLLANLV